MRNQNQIKTEFKTTFKGKTIQPNLTDWLTDRLAEEGHKYATNAFERAELVLPEDQNHPLHEIYWMLVSHHNQNAVTTALSQLGSREVQKQYY